MKKLVSMLTAFLLVLGFSNIGYADDDKDCGDFSSWQEAQTFFENNDPDTDPNDLDRDSDGDACETLKGYDEGASTGSSDDTEEATSDEETSSDENMVSEEDSSSDSDESSEEGAEMADTATNYPLYMGLGLAIAAFGSLLLFQKRVHS
ncbi:hypothetical protein ABFG93_06210 [Pseudalkalibacillus hwajinpoensis]|uniref:hypothetical protein n=1 Tax=Guptibacillus hwajinpoensis TaxID=208199 RepID=UPI00325A4B47